MSFIIRTIIALLIVLATPEHVCAADAFRPIVIYQGAIQTNSFNLNIHEGVERFVRTSGVPCEELVVAEDRASYMQSLKASCANGFNPVFLIYGNHVDGLQAFARNHPKIRFLILGAELDEANTFSLNFAEHEGSFLAGALAAMASKSGVIGFVSVADVPLMRRFACGYEQGARFIQPDIRVLTGFIGSYPGAWTDSAATARMAGHFMDQDADVLFQAAGGGGPAVLEAAARRGRLGIGVDRNQNGLFPGHVLTSMIKRSDQVVYAALIHAWRSIWRDNIKVFGVVQDAVGLAFDRHNAPLVSPAMRARIDELRNRIALGEIRVHDFVETGTCPQP